MQVDMEQGLLGKYNNTSQTIVQNRVRIDYILASPALAKYCREATIFNQKETHMLSDHYPILAEFIIKKEWKTAYHILYK